MAQKTFKLKETISVRMTYVYHVPADSPEDAKEQYENRLAGSLEQQDCYHAHCSEGIVVDKKPVDA